jgi:hypothetical protein
VEAAKARGLDVFYDEDKGNEWWGRSVIREQRRVYGSQTRFFVPFISTAYLLKPFPMDEFQTAMMAAVQRGDDYILPILIGSVQVPADLLHPQTRYLRAEDHTPEQMADQLVQRVGRARSSGQQPKDVAQVVHEAYELRMPKVVPDSFSKYQELQRVYDYLADRFREAVAKLTSHGFVGTVHKSDTTLTVRIERRGDTVYALNINKGGSFGDDRLDFSYDTRRIGSGINGWAVPFFDKDAGQAKLDVMDMSMFDSSGSTEGQLTKEELFIRLWDRVVTRLERG